jgi:predicted transcriptional regulator of viral defense system
MDFAKLLTLIADAPLFETGFLLAGEVNPADVRRQLSRWTAAGRLYQLRRGLYAPAPPFQKIAPHPFLVANALVTGSYVSGQSALAHYGLIPEYVAAITSVCAARPGHWVTPLGRFEFRHIKPTLLFGYQLLDLGKGQQALIATAEKALLDLIYLQPQGDSRAFIESLRLQNLDQIKAAQLREYSERIGSAKLRRAVRVIVELAEQESAEYRPL